MQGVSGVEIVVVNDGSTDSTQAIAESYGRNVILVNQPNSGVSSARRAGVRHATGDYIKFLDSDDWLACGSLMALKEMASNFPGEAIVGKAVAVRPGSGLYDEAMYSVPHNVSHSELLPKEFLLTQATASGVWLLPREHIDFDSYYNFGVNYGEEYSFCIELIRSKIIVRYCDCVVIKIRVHDSPYRLSSTKDERDHLKAANLTADAANFIKKEIPGYSAESLLRISEMCWVRARDCLRIGCPVAAEAYLRVARDTFPSVRPVGSFIYRFLCRFLGPVITEAFLVRVKRLIFKARRL